MFSNDYKVWEQLFFKRTIPLLRMSWYFSWGILNLSIHKKLACLLMTLISIHKSCGNNEICNVLLRSSICRGQQMWIHSWLSHLWMVCVNVGMSLHLFMIQFILCVLPLIPSNRILNTREEHLVCFNKQSPVPSTKLGPEQMFVEYT